MEEIWKDIDGYNGKYQISNYGLIKNIFRDILVRQSPNTRGYLKCALNRRTFNVHRLVAKMFIANPNNKLYVNHINNIQTDNMVSNLEWVTPMENSCHASSFRQVSSSYVGVNKRTTKTKVYYRATIFFNSKYIHLGHYSSEEEAYQARVNYEKENRIENKYL
jgi:hypothetical protein